MSRPLRLVHFADLHIGMENYGRLVFRDNKLDLFFTSTCCRIFLQWFGIIVPVISMASGYVIAGGILGSYLAQNPLVFKTARFRKLLGIFGIAFTLVAIFSEIILKSLQVHIVDPQAEPNTIFYRLGFVLLLTALVSYISLRVNHIPYIIILAARNTLLIYVVHLIILYGSAWSPGINLLWGYGLSSWQSFGAAVIDDATPFFQKMRDSVLVDAAGKLEPFPWQGPGSAVVGVTVVEGPRRPVEKSKSRCFSGMRYATVCEARDYLVSLGAERETVERILRNVQRW